VENINANGIHSIMWASWRSKFFEKVTLRVLEPAFLSKDNGKLFESIE